MIGRGGRERWLRAGALVAGLLALGGCKLFRRGEPPPWVTGGGGVGAPCETAEACRPGLVCDTASFTCQPSGAVPEGAICTLTADCADALYCGADRTCQPAGESPAGTSCTGTGDCERGLVCVVRGFFPTCEPAGMGDLGAECADALDCFAGLVCVDDRVNDRLQCASPPAAPAGTPTPPTVPFWPGVTGCESGEQRVAHFEVPRFTGDDGDFFRLPFPNDARRRADGRPDLRGFPVPTLPLDVLGRYVEVAEADLDGFGLNPTIHFRFGAPYDWATVAGALQLVDVDPDSPERGRARGVAWLTTAGPISRYLCEDWLGVRTGHGDPLRPGTTYALVVSRSVVPASGGAYRRDDDFEAMLAPTAPSDAALSRAHEAYAPLRTWLAEAETPSVDDVLVATVFTTQSARDPLALRDAVHDAPLPVARDLVRCAPGVVSPCDDGTAQRSCEGAEGDGFVEIHGRLALPRFQRGTAPYRQPADGGDIVWTGGRPALVDTQDVCFALTVPVGDAPEAGWPLVVVGHGTGGSFRTAARNGYAEALARAELDGAPLPTATLAIDLPVHGARRGASTESPDVLFFNVENPRAARDNVIQGAADLFALVRWAREGGLDATSSPTDDEIRFDPARLGLFGHSQGAIHADLVLPYEGDVVVAVLSGASGDLTLSMLHKTSPTNIAAIVPFALLDPDAGGRLAAGDFHPVLGLFQTVFDAADPVNHAEGIWRARVEGVHGHHHFTTFGDADTYTPTPVQQARAVAAGLPHVAPRAIALPLPEVGEGLTENVEIDGERFTVALRSYLPAAGEDGHFVAFATEAGRRDALRFLLEGLAGRSPVVD